MRMALTSAACHGAARFIDPRDKIHPASSPPISERDPAKSKVFLGPKIGKMVKKSYGNLVLFLKK
jgi:hypothetical protein